MIFSLIQRIWWVVRGLLVLANNLYCIPTYVTWCLLMYPLLLFNPEVYYAVEGQLFHWLLTMVAFWSHSAGYQIIETGDVRGIDMIKNKETLVLVNHQSTSDVPLLMAAYTTRPSLLPHLNWIMDAVFKYTNFGIVSYLHGDFFINAGREKREASIIDLVKFLKRFYVPRKRKWLVLFPEGGFLRKRKDTSNRYCQKLGIRELHNVTLPRMGAIQAIVDTVGPKPYPENREHEIGNYVEGIYGEREGLKYIVDMTIAYPKGEPLDLVAVVTGCVPPCNIYFHYRIFPINQVPTDKKELQSWLYELYSEKEDMLEDYYATGVWLRNKHPAPEQRLIRQDLSFVYLVHIFFICSTFLHLYTFSVLWQSS